MKLVNRINRVYIIFGIIRVRCVTQLHTIVKDVGSILKNWALCCIEIYTINKKNHLKCLKHRENRRSYCWALVARFREWFVYLSFCFQNRIPRYMGHIEKNTVISIF